MNHARADALAARHRLTSRGWIAARNNANPTADALTAAGTADPA